MSTVPDTRLTATETPTVSQEDCLAQLSGVVREDYEAVAVDGVPVNEQARRRGVYPSTVSTNVKRGHERIASFIGDQPGVTTTPRDSYDVKVKHVGGREPDGEPTTIGHWTFQTRMVREVVRDAIAGHKRVLNACAGKTVLDHPTGGEIIRNDINRDVDADHHFDVCSLENAPFEPQSFDAVLFDPPFDQGQADTHYEGWHASRYDTARKNLASLVKPGGVLVECGWSMDGVDVLDGWTRDELVIYRRQYQLPDMFLTVDRNFRATLADWQ